MRGAVEPLCYVFFSGIMNDKFYTHHLELSLIPFIQESYSDGHKFMQDNDPKHCSWLARQLYENNHINWWLTSLNHPI